MAEVRESPEYKNNNSAVSGYVCQDFDIKRSPFDNLRGGLIFFYSRGLDLNSLP